MKKHFIEDDSVELDFSVCGIHRINFEPKEETRKKSKVTCSKCKKVLKARGE